jgi:hypothetical protein
LKELAEAADACLAPLGEIVRAGAGSGEQHEESADSCQSEHDANECPSLDAYARADGSQAKTDCLFDPDPEPLVRRGVGDVVKTKGADRSGDRKRREIDQFG